MGAPAGTRLAPTLEKATLRYKFRPLAPLTLIPNLIWATAFGIQFGLLTGVVCLALAYLSGALTFRLLRLQVGWDGITADPVNHLRWAEVKLAQRKRLLGQEFLYVTRTSGLPWWMPLDLITESELRSALVDFAPHGNPIRTCLVPE